MELLERIKRLLDIVGNEHDELLELYVEIAEEEVLDYCGDVAIPDNLIAQMVVIKFQRRGTESLSNSNYAGNGETFLQDYPSNIINRLERLKRSNRRLRTL